MGGGESAAKMNERRRKALNMRKVAPATAIKENSSPVHRMNTTQRFFEESPQNNENQLNKDKGNESGDFSSEDFIDTTGQYFEAEFMPRDCLEAPSREMLMQESENRVLKV